MTPMVPLKNEPPTRQAPIGWKETASNDLMNAVILIRENNPLIQDRKGRSRGPGRWDRFFVVDPQELKAVADYYLARGFHVDPGDPKTSELNLRGPSALFASAFQIKILESPNGKRFMYTGQASAPANIAPYIDHLIGLNSTTFKPMPVAPIVNEKTPYSLDGIVERYNFPNENQGKGEVVAIIVMDGGFLREDAEAFWREQGLDPFPSVVYNGEDKPVGHPRMHRWLEYWDLHADQSAPPIPTAINSRNASIEEDLEAHWTYETTMNTQVIAALAPQAQFHIFNIGDKPYAMVANLIQFMREVQPTVIVGSFGYNERDDNLQRSFEHVLSNFAAIGGTSVFSSGNYGSNAMSQNLLVTYPASSPHAVALGGETIESYGAETRFSKVWNTHFAEKVLMAGSGGVSGVFINEYPWQVGAKAAYAASSGMTLPPGRALPDMCMVSDVHVGPLIQVAEWRVMSGGTSLAAQLGTALLARIRGRLTEEGHSCHDLHHYFYDPDAAPVFTGVSEPGNNWVPVPNAGSGPFDCKPGEKWNPCVGLGYPDGAGLLEVLLQKTPLNES